MNALIEQITWLAFNLYHEARGESMEGKVAVAHVTLNRLRKEHRPLKEVILRPWQFSWANKGARPPIKDYAAFIECQEAAMLCFEERLEGKDLFEATHYYNPEVASPEWAKTAKEICIIGNHRFMKE